MNKDIYNEKSPPGWKGTVKAMKRHKDIDNPYALSWWMKNNGEKAHYKNKDGKPEKKEKYKDESKKHMSCGCKGGIGESFVQWLEQIDPEMVRWLKGER